MLRYRILVRVSYCKGAVGILRMYLVFLYLVFENIYIDIIVNIK